ncbi:hypothetical protein [Flammeovirga agarivorans]|uniref:Uncharacterized protein n=1 Tax=Flammeovirga agarivorans TaxID=2726742 RepID=A0A7X8SPN4_9BACT|nr:hypothetical protein [Flammeovirga agarivorans]NLR93967.1 hypothetical protein [Flammeovirga agarivorans]
MEDFATLDFEDQLFDNESDLYDTLEDLNIDEWGEDIDNLEKFELDIDDEI